MYERTGNINDDTKNILVRRFTAQIWSILMTQNSYRKPQTLRFWKSWNLFVMLATRLVITKHASLELDNQSSKTSCSGLKIPKTKMYFG